MAELQGNSALAGGLGAAYGENSARIIAGILYPDEDIDKLSQDKRQQVSALAQLAACLTTAALGGDAQDINTAMAGGKNAIENNYLSLPEARRKAYLSWIKPNWKGEELTEDEKKELEFIEKLDKERDLILLDTYYAGNISSSACQGLLQEVWQIQKEYGENSGINQKYSDVYREDWKNLNNILLGLDKDTVSYWKDIEAISKVNGRPLLEVKSELRWALAANSLAKALAAAMGSNVNAENWNIKANKSTENIPNIKGTQVGLRNPAQIDSMKQDMMNGNYDFRKPDNIIAGYVDAKGNYYISEGHHRMVAAMEIYKTTGDASYVNKLLLNGKWTKTQNPPVDSKPLPKR